MLNLSGNLVPLVTPFTDDGSDLSEVRFARLVRRHASQGAAGFAVCTDMGEFPTLSFSERKRVLELAVRESQGSLPVITNVSTLSTSASLDLTQHAARHGARAAILMPPYYGVLSQAEMIDHVRCVASYSGFGIILVDPLQALAPDSLGALSRVHGVSVARPSVDLGASASDWFSVLALSVFPMAAFPDAAPTLFVGENRAAVAKALYEEDGLETGRPRMPVKPFRLQSQSAA